MERATHALHQLFKDNAHTYTDSLRLRLHRALSWLKAAETKKNDLDICFICLWICFNAIYANDFESTSDRHTAAKFLSQICLLDKQNKLYSLVWETFSNNIRVLLNNEFAFQPFWDEYGGFSEPGSQDWKTQFENEKHKVKKAIEQQNTERILIIVFRRLYTIRNQILHGGATYNSSVNKSQKKDACAILLRILPIIIEIIMRYPDEDWGNPYYPLVVET